MLLKEHQAWRYLHRWSDTVIRWRLGYLIQRETIDMQRPIQLELLWLTLSTFIAPRLPAPPLLVPLPPIGPSPRGSPSPKMVRLHRLFSLGPSSPVSSLLPAPRGAKDGQMLLTGLSLIWSADEGSCCGGKTWLPPSPSVILLDPPSTSLLIPMAPPTPPRP